jgi:hypothetical protein
VFGKGGFGLTLEFSQGLATVPSHATDLRR